MAVAAFNCSTSIALYNAHDAAFRQRWKVKWSGERRRCFVSFAKIVVLNFYRLPFTSTFILLLVFLHSIQSTRSLFVFILLRKAFRTVVTVVFLFL